MSRWLTISLPVEGTQVQKIPHAAEELMPRVAMTEPEGLGIVLLNKRNHGNEKPTQCNKEPSQSKK